MLLLDICIMVVAFLFLLCAITQVLLPVLSGEPMFPSFRKSVVRAEIEKTEQALETVAEAEHLKRVVTEINRRTAELGKKE